MNPEELSALIASVLSEAVAAGELALADTDIPAEPKVERPKNRDHGDWATNVAMQLAKKAGIAPRDLAQIIQARLQNAPGVAQVDIAGPGFINITLDAAAAGEVVRTILEQGQTYGHNDSAAGQVINMEFVSANPTGPLHIGHTRWAALGDAIARLLRASGANVTNEYYINDAGAQMDVFASSVWSRMYGKPVPKDGYPGEYIVEIADQIRAEAPQLAELDFETDFETALPELRQRAYEIQLAEIKQTLADFDVNFDVWFSEKTLHDSGAITEAVQRLREQGWVEDRDGAVWLKTTEFGDDKDRVLIRANGVPTYFAADAAYYLSKKDRGFDQKIYLLGADHHGYVGRLKAISDAAGDDSAKNIEILIGQLISVDGARLSKRAGNIIELNDLIEWLGSDALRYDLARYPADSPITIDPELLRSKTNDNPVYYVQYAHARSHSASATAEAHGVTRDEAQFDPALLTHETEEELIAMLTQFPTVVGHAAATRQPHRVARHLEVIAGAYHSWYAATRIVPSAGADSSDGQLPEPTAVNFSRRWLNDATQQVLANGLALLGVSAPEKM